MKRLRRGCYDKYHRCPGWAGGGMRFPKKDVCKGGSLTDCYEGRLWFLRFNYHPACGTLILPHWTRWLDWSWVKWAVPFRIRTSMR